MDGDISGDIVVSGSVDTTKAGVYTLIYTVKNTAGLTASINRRVEIAATRPYTISGRIFGFNMTGVTGTAAEYQYKTDIDGPAVIILSGINESRILVTVYDDTGNDVFNTIADADETFQFEAPKGDYTVRYEIVESSAPSYAGLMVLTPGGIVDAFPNPEIPF